MIKTWLDKAKYYSHTIMGIISLMIVLDCTYIVSAIAYVDRLGQYNQTLLILFVVIFPFVLFGGLLWVVAKHPTQTVDVRNFKNEEVYLRVIRIMASIGEKYKDSDDVFVSEHERREKIEDIVRRMMMYSRSFSSENRYILWVDDNPDNNTYERIAFEQLGFRFVLACSTREALSLIYKEKYTAIISDMERAGEKCAGYLLLSEIKKKEIDIPYIIYTGYSTVEIQNEARLHGAFGLTDNPDELMELVDMAEKK